MTSANDRLRSMEKIALECFDKSVSALVFWEQMDRTKNKAGKTQTLLFGIEGGNGPISRLVITDSDGDWCAQYTETLSTGILQENGFLLLTEDDCILLQES